MTRHLQQPPGHREAARRAAGNTKGSLSEVSKRSGNFANGAGCLSGSTAPRQQIAALFVETGGSYYGIPGVDPWDAERDARKYSGPHPVVAHPPCQRWGKFWAGQPLWIKRTGQRKRKGDDGGAFAAALASVREWGGVLEHPWQSHAWPHFGLNVPPREGGWVNADFNGGWTCCVEQGACGHYARKPTLLLVYGIDPPPILWGETEAKLDPELVERIGLAKARRMGELATKGGGVDNRHRIATPPEFRDLLIEMARSAAPRQHQEAVE